MLHRDCFNLITCPGGSEDNRGERAESAGRHAPGGRQHPEERRGRDQAPRL